VGEARFGVRGVVRAVKAGTRLRLTATAGRLVTASAFASKWRDPFAVPPDE